MGSRRAKTDELIELYRRTVLRGQTTLDGAVASRTTVRPAQEAPAPVRQAQPRDEPVPTEPLWR